MIGGLLQLQKQKSTTVLNNSGLQVESSNQQQSSLMPQERNIKVAKQTAAGKSDNASRAQWQ